MLRLSVTYFIKITNALKNVLGLQIMYLSRDIKLQSISSKKRNDIFARHKLKIDYVTTYPSSYQIFYNILALLHSAETYFCTIQPLNVP